MPRPRKQKVSGSPGHSDVLEMALKGYQEMKEKAEAAIAHIQDQLGSAKRSYKKIAAVVSEELAPTRKRRKRRSKMSAEGRARIAAATKARWARVRAEKGKAGKKTSKKKGPKLSAAERAKLSGGQAT